MNQHGDASGERPSPPSYAERDQEIRRLAEQGDFRGVYQHVQAMPIMALDPATALARMAHAVETASQQEPTQFSDALYRQMLAFSTTLLLRLQYRLADRLSALDQRSGMTPLIEEVETIEKFLPKIHQLQGQLAELAHAWASTTRQWRLARRHAAEQGGGNGHRKALVNGVDRLFNGPHRNGNRRLPPSLGPLN